ncbi:MAG TPA: CYTH domain-containing protein [Candidatus Hydrogenedentes bacterium]|nr:CYTH domain-containing protein [Candidatus Hydrogenedentota bacterium]HPG65520.1 CYTH domain-containing protein [Candidatus Hydrogenedentota bacterium]
MGIEIERKFLVTDGRWREGATGVRCRQGYLAVGPPVAVRVRLMGGKGTLNVKKATADIVRDEFEYAIPVEDVERILNGLCVGHIIEKTRYRVPYGGVTWEIDEFEGANAGLIVAEVELEDEHQPFERPPWLGAEVSGDVRYFNASLVERPYSMWGKR